jgi:hypothetical protein
MTLFLVFYGLTFEADLMRNVKSLLLFLLSLKYIENRNWVKYFLLNFIGLSFHWSSFIFLPLYFFLHKPISLRTFIVLFIAGNIIFLLQISFIKPIILFIGNALGGTYQERVTTYLNSDIYGRSAVFSLGYLERFFTSAIILFYYGKLKMQSKSNILFLNAFIIYILLYLFGREIEIFSLRFCALFAFSYWILIPQAIQVSDNIMKYILLLAFSILSVAKIHIQTNTIFYQYDTILSGKIKTYEERYKIFEKNIDDALDRK